MTTASIPESVFDVKRALFLEKPLQETLTIRDTLPLRDALSRGFLQDNTQVLVSELEDGPLIIETWQLLAHPIAEGTWRGKSYAAAFCAICNSATTFLAEQNGVQYHFTQGGLYNGLLIMRDTETGSYWDHITGECLYGPSRGKQLTRLNTLLFMTARQALTVYPNALVVINKLSPENAEWARQRDLPRLQKEPDYGPLIGSVLPQTFGAEDKRLPRLEMGLGVWTEKTHRYYAIQRLNALNNLVLDEIDGRKLIVYIDPESGTPSAIYVEATSAVWQGTEIRLNTNFRVRDGLLLDASGRPQSTEHPSQLFQRWYGFSLTFPGAEIYTK